MATGNLETALIVLAIGMITVFIVLGLVVLTGQLHIAVITAAVAQLSEGKASVVKIEKNN